METNTRNNLSQRSTEVSPQPVVVGYAVVPSNIDKDTYLKSVYKNKTLMMRTVDGNLFRNVLCDKDKLMHIQFPEDDKGFGSLLVCINVPMENRKIVISVVDFMGDAAKTLSQNQYSIEKISDIANVATLWDADNAELNISVSANQSGVVAKTNIQVTNPDKNAELNVEVSGDINVKATNKVHLMANQESQFTVEDETGKVLYNLDYVRGTGLTVTDEFNNSFMMNKDIVRLYNKAGDKIIEMNRNGLSFGSANKSAEQAVLGNTLDKLLKQFIQIVEDLIIISPLGPLTVSPVSVQALGDLSNQIDNILSKVSTLD